MAKTLSEKIVTAAYTGQDPEELLALAQLEGGTLVNSVNGQTGAVTLTATDIDALPSLTAVAATVVGWNFGGDYTEVPYSQDTTGFNLVMRDINGHITGLTPTDGTHVANKNYVDAQITAAGDGLVSQTATASVVYGTDGSSAQTTLPYDTAATANTIPQRGAFGVLAVGTPTQPGHAANKAYVDASVFSGAYSDLTGAPLVPTAGTIQLQLNNEDLIWPTDISSGKIRLYDSTPGSEHTFYGFGIQSEELVYQVDSSIAAHVFMGQTGTDTGVEIFRAGVNTGVNVSVNMNLNNHVIADVGDPSNVQDAVNLRTLNGRLSPAQRTAIDALTVISTADATDPDTTMALANECKAKLNDIINALKAT